MWLAGITYPKVRFGPVLLSPQPLTHVIPIKVSKSVVNKRYPDIGKQDGSKNIYMESWTHERLQQQIPHTRDIRFQVERKRCLFEEETNVDPGTR